MMFQYKDPKKLRMIADWFDKYDERTGYMNDEAQKDLRRMADTIEEKLNDSRKV